ncbi:MAG: electron transfer flavoprotein subunit alpha/FixB family protein, partial [Colwellia sp.]|nr:electron transfer flavoprotein subunit alpha/FixB family protein [Colwellia sp.]
MSILVFAEHDNSTLKAETLKTVAAAQGIGSDITILVAGFNCQAVAESAAKVNGVTKVLVADNAAYEHQIAENISLLVVELAADYEHIIATALSTGKNFMPRVAALLDVTQISDIIGVESSDTFVRPIYAGNAIATVQSLDSKKIITVRATGFDAVATDGNAEIVAIDSVTDAGISSHISDELTVSERPDLGA